VTGRILSSLGSRQLWGGPALWVVVLLIAANGVAAGLHDALRREREAGLLANVHAANERETPRYDWSVGERPGAFLRYMPDATKTPLVIVSGMSQMYAINERRPEDLTISELLDDALQQKGIRAFGLAAPNLDNEEALLILLTSMENPRTKSAVFVYGVCFDKFRNVDLRPGFAALLADRQGLRESWARACNGRESRYPLACQKMAQTLHDLAAPAQASDDFEHRVRRAIASISPLMAHRAEVNAYC
jgi:hypothetical protein